MQHQDSSKRKAGGDHKKKGFRAYLGYLPSDLVALERSTKQGGDGPKPEKTYITGDL